MNNGNGIVVKRNAKDSVFTHLFQNKRYVLQIFKALHPEDKDVTEDMIEIVTLENIIVDDIYNDLGFMVGELLVILVEAQSTWTVNIIIRLLLYIAQTYHDYIGKKELNVYGSRKIAVPKPELYVIYTGDEEIEKDVISLSEEFFGGVQTDLDVRVHVLRDGRQGDIINQYVMFTKILNEQVKLYGRTSRAARETIRICRDRDVLAGYLAEHEQEVQGIMMTLFDNDQIMKAYAREKVEEGWREGRMEGRMEGRVEGRMEGRMEGRKEVARNMLQSSFPLDTIVRVSGLSLDEVKVLAAQIQQ